MDGWNADSSWNGKNEPFGLGRFATDHSQQTPFRRSLYVRLIRQHHIEKKLSLISQFSNLLSITCKQQIYTYDVDENTLFRISTLDYRI